MAWVFWGCSAPGVIKGRVWGNDPGASEQGVLVQLLTIDDAGQTLGVLEETITNTNGEFEFAFQGNPNASWILKALFPSGARLAFVGSKKTGLLEVSRRSDAIVKAVLWVTQSEGHPSLEDFTLEEIQSIVATVESSLTFTALQQLTDEAAVRKVVEAAGSSIPLAAGGEISAQESAGLAPPDLVTSAPALAASAGCSRDAVFVTGNLFEFDLMENGVLCNINGVGTSQSDALDGGMQLSLIGDTFVSNGLAFFPGDLLGGTPTRTIEDDREYVFGSEATQTGLEVTRKVYVPEGQDYVRYLEILSNPTNDDVSVTVQLSGEVGLGALSSSPALLADGNGDGQISSQDAWAVLRSTVPFGNYPSLGLLWNPGVIKQVATQVDLPPESGSAHLIQWHDVVIPAGRTQAIVTYLTVHPSISAARAQSLLQELQESPDLTGLSASELASLYNLGSTVGNIVAKAGSVASYAQVTVTNTRSSDALTLEAMKDGSFRALIEATSGDNLLIESSDGRTQTLTVP